jgi:hypothetical protein
MAEGKKQKRKLYDCFVYELTYTLPAMAPSNSSLPTPGERCLQACGKIRSLPALKTPAQHCGSLHPTARRGSTAARAAATGSVSCFAPWLTMPPS